MTITGNFERFQYVNFETNFKGKPKPFTKTVIPLFSSECIENASFPCQKSIILRQIEWWKQNWPITKNGVLPVTTVFF